MLCGQFRLQPAATNAIRSKMLVRLSCDMDVLKDPKIIETLLKDQTRMVGLKDLQSKLHRSYRKPCSRLSWYKSIHVVGVFPIQWNAPRRVQIVLTHVPTFGSKYSGICHRVRYTCDSKYIDADPAACGRHVLDSTRRLTHRLRFDFRDVVIVG
jgi:hypothetical protein